MSFPPGNGGNMHQNGQHQQQQAYHHAGLGQAPLPPPPQFTNNGFHPNQPQTNHHVNGLQPAHYYQHMQHMSPGQVSQQHHVQVAAHTPQRLHQYPAQHAPQQQQQQQQPLYHLPPHPQRPLQHQYQYPGNTLPQYNSPGAAHQPFPQYIQPYQTAQVHQQTTQYSQQAPRAPPSYPPPRPSPVSSHQGFAHSPGSRPSELPPISTSTPTPTPARQPAQQQPQQPSPIMPPAKHPSKATPTSAMRVADERRRISADGSVKKLGKDPRRSSASPVVKSPASTARNMVDAPSLLICTADELFNKAYSVVDKVADSMSPELVAQYHQLITTGLGCLKAALQSQRLTPRAEVMIRFRYGTILAEETEEINEAELKLNNAVTLCGKHRFSDLKPYIQFHSLKLMHHRNSKAALIAVDKSIDELTVDKNIYWVYAFRFLKASFFLRSNNPADQRALENLRSIAQLAASRGDPREQGDSRHRGDRAVAVMAYILEGLTHLKTMKNDAPEKVQACIAQATKYQLEETVHIPQLDVLLRLLDLSCCLVDKVPNNIDAKLEELGKVMDELRPQWKDHGSELMLPLRKHAGSAKTISNDTRGVLSPGDDEVDYLIMSSLNINGAYGLAYALHGLATLNKLGGGKKSLEAWGDSIKLLSDSVKLPKQMHWSLAEALEQSSSRNSTLAMVIVMKGLYYATLFDWAPVKECNDALDHLSRQGLSFGLDGLCLYLKAVYHQGVGNLGEALRLFDDPRFAIEKAQAQPDSGRRMEPLLCVLAGLNALLIMENQHVRDEAKARDLSEKLRVVCAEHIDSEIKAAWNLCLAASIHSPPAVAELKRHIQLSLSGAQASGNQHCLAIALNMLRFKLFDGVVGSQAIKSAKAGSAQAKRSRNVLWMSVADGLLASSHELSGPEEQVECAKARDLAVQHATEAWERTQ